MSRRTAAALIITRGQGRDLTVFLAERAPQLRFFGGYWAMPGGTIALEDMRPSSPHAGQSSNQDTLDEDAALQVCAHRELFEETGLLRHGLPGDRNNIESLRSKRTALLAHDRDNRKDKPPSPWAEIIAGATQPPPMRSVCRIETPAFAPVRYDTVFFHVPLEDCTTGTTSVQDNAGIMPDIWPGELTEGRFWSPAEALASWRAGDLLLVPPVVIMLEHLANANDFEQFAHAIEATANSYQNGHLHQVRFSPGIVLAPLRTPTLPPATTTNCYIVGHEKLWVIDPGSPAPQEQQRLLDLLDNLTQNGQQLAGVLLTHHHPDHIGGVHALCEARGLKAYGHTKTLDRIPQDIPRGDAIEDGARIALGNSPDGKDNWELEAIHTPGHDWGHLCFRENRYDAMIVGDMMSTISTIIIDPPEGHLATYLDSLKRIGDYEISTLYPAHGPAMRDGQRLVQQYTRHRRQREATLIRVLGENSGTLEELLPKVYGDADPRLYPFAARSLQAGLEKLQEEGRAHSQSGSWQLTQRQQ